MLLTHLLIRMNEFNSTTTTNILSNRSQFDEIKNNENYTAQTELMGYHGWLLTLLLLLGKLDTQSIIPTFATF